MSEKQVIIGITGTNGAGKGTVVEFLMKELGFKHYSARGLLTKMLNEQGKELSRTNMNVTANKLRADNHPAIIAELLVKDAEKDGGHAVIESIRTPGEANLLRKFKNFRLLAVNANSKVRYDRVVTRGSSTDKIPYEQFVAEEEREMTSTDPNKQNISKCFEMADDIIDNNGTPEELREKLNEYVKKLNLAPAAADTPAAAAPAAAATGSYVCHCGKTGYKIKGAPKMAAYCHCITCRQYGGVANVAVYNDADVEYTETTKENLIDYKSAENKWRRHCKNCGCWVNNWSPAMGFIAPLLGIKWNDDGAIPHPQFHIWTGEKGESQIHDDLTQFEGWPQ